MLKFRTINSIILAALILLFGLSFFFTFSPYFYLLLIGAWVLITLIGSAKISWNYFLTSLNRNKTITENKVAITFDDGPNEKFTPQVLDLLDRFNAKATFFCIGKHIEAHPGLFNEIIKKGHKVGNHTYSHANNFGFFSVKRVVSELERTNGIVRSTSGLEMNLYRPAFGITNPPIAKAVKSLGLTSIGWSKRSFDTTNFSEKTILKRITEQLNKGDIILLHDSSLKSVKVLEQLLLFLQTNQLQSVTVDQLLDIEPYA